MLTLNRTLLLQLPRSTLLQVILILYIPAIIISLVMGMRMMCVMCLWGRLLHHLLQFISLMGLWCPLALLVVVVV